MQKLTFEPAWEKALSVKDRNRIEQIFSQTIVPKGKTVQFTPLWQALNYKKELLVTMLVHNVSQETFSFRNTRLQYMENGKIVAEYSFTLPSLSVEPQFSMPWTFIFPAESLEEGIICENGHLELAGDRK